MNKNPFFPPPFVSGTSPLLVDDLRVIILISCRDTGVKCLRGSSLPDSLLCSVLRLSECLAKQGKRNETGWLRPWDFQVTHTLRDTYAAHTRRRLNRAKRHTTYVCAMFAGGEGSAGNQVYTKHGASSDTHQLSGV